MSEHYDTHTLSLTDIPHVIRLAGDGVVLDSCIRFTTGAAASGGWLTSMMPHTSRHTLVARYSGQRVVGQFYILPDGTTARIVYLAPGLPDNGEDSAWLLMLDAMVREAGRRGAHTLTAELDEDSVLFTTLRQSGFAVYARQHVWLAPPPDPFTGLAPGHDIQVADTVDEMHITLFVQRTIPSLLKQVTAPPGPDGFVYRENGTIMGFIAVAEGRDGVYMMPYLDHRLAANPADVLGAAALLIPHADRRTLSVRVRRYQGWMNTSLEAAGYDLAARQALMVRHIAAGIHSPEFAPLSRKLAAGTLPRRTEKVPEVCIDAEAAIKVETMTTEIRTTIGSREPCDGLPRTAPQRHPVCPNGGVPG